jgi:hypothetical protein
VGNRALDEASVRHCRTIPRPCTAPGRYYRRDGRAVEAEPRPHILRGCAACSPRPRALPWRARWPSRSSQATLRTVTKAGHQTRRTTIGKGQKQRRPPHGPAVAAGAALKVSSPKTRRTDHIYTSFQGFLQAGPDKHGDSLRLGFRGRIGAYFATRQDTDGRGVPLENENEALEAHRHPSQSQSSEWLAASTVRRAQASDMPCPTKRQMRFSCSGRAFLTSSEDPPYLSPVSPDVALSGDLGWWNHSWD